MIRGWIAQWTHGEPWRTWVAHAAIALILTAVFGWWVGWLAAVFYYFIRELEQILYNTVARKRLDPFDHFMDVAVPAAVVLPFALVWG